MRCHMHRNQMVLMASPGPALCSTMRPCWMKRGLFQTALALRAAARQD